MAKRKIIKIDDSKCNGCGLCIPNCPEGALQIIDGCYNYRGKGGRGI
jgi:ferredoxin